MGRDADDTVMGKAVCAWKLHSSWRDADQLSAGGAGIQFSAP